MLITAFISFFFYVEELENLLKVILNVDKNITVWQVNKVLRKVSSPFLI